MPNHGDTGHCTYVYLQFASNMLLSITLSCTFTEVLPRDCTLLRLQKVSQSSTLVLLFLQHLTQSFPPSPIHYYPVLATDSLPIQNDHATVKHAKEGRHLFSLWYPNLRSSLLVQLHCHQSSCTFLCDGAIDALPEEVGTSEQGWRKMENGGELEVGEVRGKSRYRKGGREGRGRERRTKRGVIRFRAIICR